MKKLILSLSAFLALGLMTACGHKEKVSEAETEVTNDEDVILDGIDPESLDNPEGIDLSRAAGEASLENSANSSDASAKDILKE